MNGRTLALVALTLITAIGCGPARRKNDAYQELLSAEKRYLEDQLYDLNYENGVLLEKYKSAQRENAALRRALQDRAGGESRDARPAAPNGAPLDADGITPPQIEFGEPSSSGPPITPPVELDPVEPESGSIDDAAQPTGEFPTSHEELVDPRITHVHLNPLLTGGADFDEHSGDDGISVVIEPRNAADKYVPVAGPISIVVLDGAKQGDESRVARWDFTVEETRELMAGTAFGKGIHLRLPWPAEPPDNSRLTLFARYATPDGTKLEANREMFIELPGQTSRPWKPMAPAVDTPEDLGTLQPIGPEIEIHPGAAIPRRTIASNPEPAALPRSSPPPGPTVSEQNDRPRWSPYR